MAYEPTEWKTGDVITADKLNDLESRTGGGIMVVNMTYDESTTSSILNNTWQEIFDAMCAGAIAIIKVNDENNAACYPIINASSNDGQYTIVANSNRFVTSSADGYPIQPNFN